MLSHTAPPSGPINLITTTVTYENVSLSWIAPNDTGGYDIEKYIITVTPLDGSDPWNITTTDNYTVTGLLPGQSYNFTVQANNIIGLGEKSNTISVSLGI